MSTLCPIIPQCCDDSLFAYNIAGDTTDITAQLTGLSWLLPCLEPASEGVCQCAATFSSDSILMGTPGKVFNVRIRIRGVAELKTYPGGITTGFWTVGGVPDADPTNIYRLTISNPLQTYYLNTGDGITTVMDYEENIIVAVGGVVALYASSVDNGEYANPDNLKVSNNDPLYPIIVTQPYDGQFMQLDALSATLI